MIFKIPLLVYKPLNGHRPKNIPALFVSYGASRPHRSSGAGLPSIPSIKTEQGGAVFFSFYAPDWCNKHPEYLRSARAVITAPCAGVAAKY